MSSPTRQCNAMLKYAESRIMQCTVEEAAKKTKREMKVERDAKIRRSQITQWAENWQRKYNHPPTFADTENQLKQLQQKANKHADSSSSVLSTLLEGEEKAEVVVVTANVSLPKEKPKRKVRSPKLGQSAQSSPSAETELSIAKRMKKRKRSGVKQDVDDVDDDRAGDEEKNPSAIVFSGKEFRLLDLLNVSIGKLVNRTLSAQEMRRLCVAYEIE